jgi:hypothetical protein
MSGPQEIASISGQKCVYCRIESDGMDCAGDVGELVCSSDFSGLRRDIYYQTTALGLACCVRYCGIVAGGDLYQDAVSTAQLDYGYKLR